MSCLLTNARVFRADKKGDESLFRNILPRGFADDIIGSSAHIVAGCTVMPFIGEIYFSVAEDGKGPVGYKRDLVFVSERFIDVFGIKMIEGDSHALEGPNSVIIPRSLAENLFPGERATGKLLKTDTKYMELPREITVTGVYEDFPTSAICCLTMPATRRLSPMSSTPISTFLHRETGLRPSNWCR